jgi:hypothetical protein
MSAKVMGRFNPTDKDPSVGAPGRLAAADKEPFVGAALAAACAGDSAEPRKKDATRRMRESLRIKVPLRAEQKPSPREEKVYNERPGSGAGAVAWRIEMHSYQFVNNFLVIMGDSGKILTI